ncbi:hypothetical protein FRUB_08078 [Fimbriiglobus ruber]|uniref:Uncharacterized protein n=1 Tax=Fimbriiglobus ruber TaxID=1908690 RepID=A0A225DGI4_9BACT|nr:hypothetical protein FRUB_08078 [Fimbriiglobus ruber]
MWQIAGQKPPADFKVRSEEMKPTANRHREDELDVPRAAA